MGRESILVRNKVIGYCFDNIPIVPEKLPLEANPRNLSKLLYELHHSKNLEPEFFLSVYFRGAGEFIKLVEQRNNCPFNMLREAAGWVSHPFTFKYAKEYYVRHYIQDAE